MLEVCGCVLYVECFNCEYEILTSNSRSGPKLAFHAMFADYLEWLSTHDADLYLVADVH